MTYEEFLEAAKALQEANPDWRWGQVLFNLLAQARPDLSGLVHSVSGLDPFYNDNNAGNFLAFVEENW